MPDTQAGITSPPAVLGQPYDATSTDPLGPWDKIGDVMTGGGQGSGNDIPGADGPSPWRQT